MKKMTNYLFFKTGWLTKKLVLIIVVLGYFNFTHGQNTNPTETILVEKDNKFSLIPDSISFSSTPSEREAQTVGTLEELISGRFAGVRMVKTDGAPGAAYSMQLRGVRSFRGDNEPLYILDGIILNPVWKDELNAFENDVEDHQATQNILSRINPQDIAKIEILKNADVTAIYGNMGANGVVIITTKSGNGEKFAINVQSNLGISTIRNKMNVLNSDDYIRYQKSINSNYASPSNPIDWQKDITRMALTQNYYLDIGGNNNKMKYFISMNYSNNEGVIDRSDVSQASIRVNLDRMIGNNAVFGTRMLFGYTNNNMIQATTPYGSLSLTKLMTKAIPFDISSDNNIITNENPRNWLDGYDDNSTHFFATPQVYFETLLYKGFKFRTVAGVDYRTKERLRWIGNETMRGRNVEGRAGRSSINLMTYNLDSQLKYNYTSKRHLFSSLLGFSVNGEYYSNQVNEGTKFFNQDLRGVGIQLAESIFPYRNYEWNNSNISGYFSGTYTFDSKYTLNGTIRGDKSNKFDKNNDDITYYPSLGLMWNLINEGFLSDQNLISKFNIRGSWGRTGKQTSLPLDLSSSYITGVSPELEIENNVTNYYEMRWNNVNTQQNIGIDIGFRNDKITASIDLYNSDSKDNLRYYYHTRTGDYIDVYNNNSSINNKGAEINLNIVALENSEFDWNINGSFAYNLNKITDTGSDGDVFGNVIGEKDQNPLVININRKGEQVGAFWGYKSQGIVTEKHALFIPPFNNVRLVPGDVKLIDTNGNGNITDEDQTIIGNPIPKYIFGLNSDFRYKKFSFQLLFEGAAKFDIANMNLLNDIYVTGNDWNVSENIYKDAYSESNLNGKSPRFNALGVKEVSSRIIEDGSYLRFSDLIIGYDFQFPTLKWIENIGLTFAAKNIFVITNYSGYDPNVNSYNYNLSSIGIDNAAYPSSKTYILGVKVKF